MPNYRMMEKLKNGEAIDVNVIGTSLQGFEGKVWELEDYQPGVDYCDAEDEQWIWSIGKRITDGKIFAAVDARFYDNPMFDCLWLR